MRKIVHASLFSGFGGPDLAAKWMGWDNAFHCEINEFCNTILEYWFPKSKTYKDVTTADFTEWRGKIDVLTGGFPCQPFSVAGQRKGADDNRYLWPHFLRVIREVRPTWVIGENVGGILTMVQPGEEIEVGCQASLFDEGNKETILEQEFVVETICKDLECEGYSVQPILIPACAVGARHRRDRIWFIAYRTDAGIESVQPGWEDGVLSGTSITDTYGKRCNNRSDNWEERPIYYDWQRYSEKDQSERNKWQHRTGEDGTVTSDSQCQRSGQIHEEIQPEQSDGNGINSIGDEWNVADTKGEQLENSLRTWGRCSRSANLCSTRAWQGFPTQSPVCRGDDGISSGLDGITFSKWRQESVKGFGNAIVPQVVLEIFKMIELIQNKLEMNLFPVVKLRGCYFSNILKNRKRGSLLKFKVAPNNCMRGFSIKVILLFIQFYKLLNIALYYTVVIITAFIKFFAWIRRFSCTTMNSTIHRKNDTVNSHNILF